MKKLLLLLTTTLLLTACGMIQQDDDAARQTAREWAEAYFNCDYHKAAEYSTPESEMYLRFAASNTTEEDLQVLQEGGGATVEVSDYFPVANDTLRVVELSVSNCLEPVAVGEAPQLADQAQFQVTLVLRDKKWKVRMEGLPRSGRQSRD